VAPTFTGTDNCEGTITPVVTTGGASNTGCAYTQTWNANYTDACNNVADQVSITYTWTVDSEIPVITLLGDATVNICQGTLYTDAGATASDNCEGNITTSIVTTGDVIDTDVPGTYYVTYDVEDACGNEAVQVVRTVIVEESAVAGTLAKTPDTEYIIESYDVSAVLTPGTGGNGTDELEYSTDGGTNWMLYTSGTAISTTGLTDVQIRTRRMANYCSPSTYYTVSWTVNSALQYVIDNTVLSSSSGTIADLTATFPSNIPPVIIAEPYKINSRMTLSGDPVPAGSTVSILITVNGAGPYPYVTNALIPSSPFWVTDLAGGIPADFDGLYGGRIEVYNITINSAGGNPLELNGAVLVESIISKNGFVNNTVLDDISLNFTIPADEAAALLWLQANTVLSSVSGTIADLTATFPSSIPPVIVNEDYLINSRMTLSGDDIPAGSTLDILITVNGAGPFPYVTGAAIPGTTFWVTDLFTPAATPAGFNAGYGDRIELYNITINSAGGNPLELNGAVLVESIISKNGFVNNTVLDDISLNWTIAPDENAALAWLQANTVLSSVSGTIADLTATFPSSIPPVIVNEDYLINSRMTLSGDAIPAGSTLDILITVNGSGPFPYVTGAAIPGTTFWVTDLFTPAAIPAGFNAGYGGRIELYNITINSAGGNPLQLNGSVLVESIISKNNFSTNTVLDDITLNFTIPADEAAALLWLQTNTVLSSVSGTIADLTATFPASIPPVIVNEDYLINSRMTLSGDAIPAGSTLDILITVNGAGPFPYVTGAAIPASPFWVTDLFDPAATPADFNAGYGGKIELYNITINSAGGNPLQLNGAVKVESIISKNGFVNNTVLDDISLNFTIPADEAAALAWLQANTVLSSVSGTIADLKAEFPDMIPPVIVDLPYKINSRITLADELPAGSLITIVRDGTPIVNNLALSGTGPFWITELMGFPLSVSADFDDYYGGAVENYVITIIGPGNNPLEFNTTVFIESIISKDVFVSNFIVLDDITLNATIPPVPSNLKVWLQGAYNSTSGEMETTLNAAGKVPLSQPYNAAPWNYSGTESVTTMPADAVDWVLIELRSDESTYVDASAALLYKDGSVTTNFTNVLTEDEYFIVVWHRNHMPVMSASLQTVPVTSYDFTVLSNLYGSTNPVPNVPAIDLGGSVYGMIAGDVTHNGILQYSGPGNDRGPIIATITATSGGTGTGLSKTVSGDYWYEDTNLDNVLSYLPNPNDRGIIVANLNTLTSSPYLNSIYTSVVPGATGGKDQGTNDGPFDIQIAESAQIVNINLITNETIENGIVDNIQFTLAWKAGDTQIAELLNSFTSDFMLAPQGEAYPINGVMHRVYVSVTPTYLPEEFIEGDQVTVMFFANSLGQSVSGRLWIADNDFTATNNAMYYVSVWGTDVTGTIQSIATGLNEIPASGSVSIYPNPVMNGLVNIGLNLEESQDVTIIVMNMNGKEIFSNSILVNAGLTVNPVELKNLQQGVYFIRVKGNKMNAIEKLLVKQKN
jgi:hypothetical protein